jgi:hypothetical protein
VQEKSVSQTSLIPSQHDGLRVKHWDYQRILFRCLAYCRISKTDEELAVIGTTIGCRIEAQDSCFLELGQNLRDFRPNIATGELDLNSFNGTIFSEF